MGVIVRKRWTAEYVRSLRESHRRAGGNQTCRPQVGDVVIIQDDKKNRNQWKLAVVKGLIKGRDGTTRAASLETSKETLRANSTGIPLPCKTKAAVRVQQIAEQSEHWTLTLGHCYLSTRQRTNIYHSFIFMAVLVSFLALSPVREETCTSLPRTYMGEGVWDWDSHYVIM